MSLVRTAGSLATELVRTAASAARHPISTASLATGLATGLVKGTAEAGVQLVRGVTGAGTGTDAAEGGVGDATRRTDEARATPDVADVETDGPPEPQVVPKPVPEIDELPEPIVITAQDAPGEEFHTEPKAASRDSEHGGPAGDREEVEGYAEEAEAALDPQADEPQPVWTSESDPAD
jgi:hypothetical protein